MEKEKALIPNSQIEQMFLRVCSDNEMEVYTNHVENGRIALATAYASRLATKVFFKLVEQSEEYR